MARSHKADRAAVSWVDATFPMSTIAPEHDGLSHLPLPTTPQQDDGLHVLDGCIGTKER